MSDSESVTSNESDSSSNGESWYSRGFCPPPRLLRTLDVDDRSYEKERDVSWSELFFDLIFVVATARLGEEFRDSIRDNDILDSFASYVCYFITFFRYWCSLVQYTTRYGSDDLFHKIFLPVFMLGVVGMTIHIKEGASSETNSTPFCICAACSSILLVFFWSRIAFYLDGRMRVGAILFGIIPESFSIAMWLLTAFVVPLESRRLFILINFISVVVSFWMFIFFLPCIYPQIAQPYPAACHKRFFCWRTKPTFQSCLPWGFVPLHLENFIERYGLIAIIFFGETIDDITDTTANHEKQYYFGLLGCFIIIVTFKLMAFDTDTEDMDLHALRRDRVLGIIWNALQYTKNAAIALLGSGMALLCEKLNVPASDLNSDTREEEIARWVVSVSCSTILFIGTLTLLLHGREFHKKEKGRESLYKDLRFIFYIQVSAHVAGSIAFCFLPRASIDQLPSEYILLIIASTNCLLVALGLLDELATLQWERKQYEPGASEKAGNDDGDDSDDGDNGEKDEETQLTVTSNLVVGIDAGQLSQEKKQILSRINEILMSSDLRHLQHTLEALSSGNQRQPFASDSTLQRSLLPHILDSARSGSEYRYDRRPHYGRRHSHHHVGRRHSHHHVKSVQGTHFGGHAKAYA